LSDDDQEMWLDLAGANRWSKNELRRRVRASIAASTPAAAARVLRLAVERRREQRWRDAAQRSDCRLETWMVRALDEAAGAVLDQS
jgi:hypothetical protein